ncbi:MAG: hypothetical protein HY824_02225 [Acidobacteria bacterium]|nr:hypothetical protein [Acidobacteriota bacterium]
MLAALLLTAPAAAQVVPAPTAPVTPQPPGVPGAAPVAPAPGVLPTPVGARTFTAPAGIIFNVVRPERVVDFELVIGYLQAALEKSANPQVRAQAAGWKAFKAAEPGPNGTVLYVFVMDPAVTGADYALGPILGDAYPDLIEPIWKLYQGALAGGGSLLNLTPVAPPPLPPPGTAPTAFVPEVRPAPPAGPPPAVP